MIQTEKMILEEIMRLLKDLENATYGETKANGLNFPPNPTFTPTKAHFPC